MTETCQCGVRLGSSHANAIGRNVVSGNFRSAVCVGSSHANRLYGNHVNEDAEEVFFEDDLAPHGLLITDSHLNVISSNNVTGNGNGVRIWTSGSASFVPTRTPSSIIGRIATTLPASTCWNRATTQFATTTSIRTVRCASLSVG